MISRSSWTAAKRGEAIAMTDGETTRIDRIEAMYGNRGNGNGHEG
jgi:hypothetical protein